MRAKTFRAAVLNSKRLGVVTSMMECGETIGKCVNMMQACAQAGRCPSVFKAAQSYTEIVLKIDGCQNSALTWWMWGQDMYIIARNKGESLMLITGYV